LNVSTRRPAARSASAMRCVAPAGQRGVVAVEVHRFGAGGAGQREQCLGRLAAHDDQAAAARAQPLVQRAQALQQELDAGHSHRAALQ